MYATNLQSLNVKFLYSRLHKITKSNKLYNFEMFNIHYTQIHAFSLTFADFIISYI
jgi:hypothetical protein